MPDSFYNLVETIKIKTDKVIFLGNCFLRLRSNLEDFVGLRYFSAPAIRAYTGQKVDFDLSCVSMKESGLSRDVLINFIDKTCRGQQFVDGYYVTDHFGEPIYLVSEGAKFFVFGENLEKVVWPYFVKYFLLIHSIKNDSLFLKAAAFSIKSRATLLLGRGSAGKTVFLSNMCLNGAEFISNSHAIIRGERLYGVASSMRIRLAAWCEELFSKDQITPGIKSGEIIIDPYSVFKVNTRKATEVKNICILDFKGPSIHKITKIPHKIAYDYAEQFSLGINVYRLEEDLLDFYKNQINLFSESYSEMKQKLKSLVEHCNCYYISSDVLNPKYREEITLLLSD
ncbi:MAG: hypothetical protein ACPLXP_01335 [Microgenomates group bacterium]